jgi:hypothetical protein
MRELSATYGIELSQCVYAKKEEETAFHYKIKVKDYSVEIRLLPMINGQTIKRSTEKEIYFCISEIEIIVSKELTVDIPPILADGKTRDASQRGNILGELERDYKHIAQIAFKRIMFFFKYSLGTPLLGQLSDYDKDFVNPMWRDELGNVLDPGIYTHRIENYFLRYSEELGVKALTVQMEPDIEKAIENEMPIELHREILLNAQSAIFENNYRRAVLELAMACELAIKRTYFSKSSPAGLALEFMEDSKNLSPRIRLTSYLTNIAEYALGEKFEDVSSPADMVNIENLFHGRDKVVHGGELCFKSEKDKKSHVLKDWWISVERLLAWLNSKRIV